MDVQMPGKDGIQATGKIKADAGTRLISVIALNCPDSLCSERGPGSNCQTGGFDG